MSKPRALGLVRDLFFRAKIDSSAEALGLDTVYASTLDAARTRCAEAVPAIVFADLSDQNFPGAETAASIRELAPHARLIGFASHVDLKPLKVAREAGFDVVLSRQEFTARLPELLKTNTEKSN
jgi:DNA-binding NarL/FixJ family response regulator